MRRLPILVVLAAVAFLAVSSFRTLCGDGSGAARAQDGSSAEEIQRRVEWLRSLPKADKESLKAALERFRALPSAEREKLRAKAAQVGPERLDGLTGRDIRALKKSRTSLETETEQVLSLIGRERLAAMTPDERAYIRSEAMRGFQRQVQRRILGLRLNSDWEQLSPEERRAQLRDGMRRVIADRESRLSDDERARILALPQKEQAEERRRLFAEFRMDQTLEFSRQFTRFRLDKFLEKPEAERTAEVRRWREKSRWHALARVLKEDLGISEGVRRDLAALGPAEWAKVMYDFQHSEKLSLADRKLAMETMIHRLAGERALDTAPREPRVPPFIRALRERRLMNGVAPRPPAGDSGESR